jgi:hypothetical protein
MKTPDYRALQMAGCRKPDYLKNRDILPRYFTGGTWHASLMKDGCKHKPSAGGSPKPKKRAKPRYQRLETSVPVDKAGYVVL